MAAGLTTPVATAMGANSPHRALDLTRADDNLTAMLKMRGSLVAEDGPNWYCGTIYTVLPRKMLSGRGRRVNWIQWSSTAANCST